MLYYLLKDGAEITAGFLAGRGNTPDDELLGRLAERSVADIRAYIRGRTLIALSNGAAIGLAAFLLGVPAALAIAVVNFVGAYIPYLGAFVAGAFAVLMALGEGDIGLALAMLGITLAVNLLLENLLEPVLVGGRLRIHPLLVLLATTFGGLIAGLIGLVLAAPALAIVLDVKRELDATGFFEDDLSGR